MAGKNKRKDGPAHKSPHSRRIERRLSPEVRQEGASAEAGREAPAAPAQPPRQKTGGFSFFKNKNRPPRGNKTKARWLKISLAAVAATALAGCIILGVFLYGTTKNDFLWLDLAQIPHNTETILYATDPATGETQVYATLFCTQNKEYVDGARIPQQLKDAFVAVEDHDFYTHKGVSFKRTLYAMANEAKHLLTGRYIGGEDGRKLGASTIDQQLIKNLTRDDEDSSMAGYLRKIREIYRALRLDAAYDKDAILNAYLNTISFTGNTAGVQAETQKLFGKNIEELTLAECASLAAITRNPARYNPAKNPEAHLQRRNYVLGEMLAQEYISQSEYAQAVAEPLALAGNEEPRREQPVTSYFTDALMDAVVGELCDTYNLSRKEANNLLYNGGLRIYTTVVPALQSAMEQQLESAALYPRPAATVRGELADENGEPLLDEDGKPVRGDIQVRPQAAMVSLQYDGGVAAVVGGLGEKTISRGFNRGTGAVRQVGSTMKPIGPYAVAFENNLIHWSSAFPDKPVGLEEDENTGEMVDWPKNVDNRYSGKDVLVREAMARSVNTIAVRVGEVAGTRSIYQFVKKDLSIPTILGKDAEPGPMVLGSSTTGITPVEMAKAYAMFGNGGVTPDIHYYTEVASGSGTTLLQQPGDGHASLSPDTAYVMNRLLREVLQQGGTAAGMSVNDGMDSVGKTGTTSDYRDHWFIGLTPYYVTASWYGYDENIALRVDSRNHPPTLAWRTVMRQAQQGLPRREFPADASVAELAYCTQSGAAAGSRCPSAMGYYRAGLPPAAECPLHGG